MHVSSWFWFALVTLLCGGIAGLLQKLSTNHISAESSLIWLVVGFLLLEPFFYPGKSVLAYSAVNLTWALFSGSGESL
jgi:transporter family protein